MHKYILYPSIIIIHLLIISTITTGTEINKEDKIIEFNDISRVDRSIVFELPQDAEVVSFNVEFTGPVDSGLPQPLNVTLDIGDNGTVDWAFKKNNGPLGYQNIFNQDQTILDLGFTPGNYNADNAIFIPADVDVSKASFELEFLEDNYLSPIIELNRPEWHPEAPYEYDPEFCIFNDRLYVAYRSYSWRDSNQSDADIMINSTADGMTWQDQKTEITKAPDTELPYTGGKRSGDFYPSMAVFKNHLYCAWESDSPLPLGSTHGDDRDILWSRFDGSTWSVPDELTAPDNNAAEDVYSLNPGFKDDYRVELCTFDNGSGEQLFAIWTANNTGDESFPEERKGDIIVSRTVDGIHWTIGVDLTFDDRRYDEDYLPTLIEFETPAGNALFAFWVSNNFANTNGSDWDIFYRYTYDGILWSEQLNLLDNAGISEPANIDRAIDEDPTLVVYNGRLYIFWRTSNPNLAAGEDIDIVMASTKNGINWTKPTEVTAQDDTLFNNRPRAVIYNGQLAVLWRAVEANDEGTIFLRLLDGETDKWSKVVQVSPRNGGGNDYSPDIIAFKDQILISWVTQDNITTRGQDSDLVIRSFMPRTCTPEVALDVGRIGISIDDWLVPKSKFDEGKKIQVELTQRLRELINDPEWVVRYTIKDEFQNEIYVIPIKTYFSSPGRVKLTNLEISYNYSISVDLGVELHNYLKDLSNNDGKDVQVVLRFESDTNGKLKISNLRVEYSDEEEEQQYNEVICIAVIGVILIVLGLAIKFMPTKDKKKENDKKQ
jgi:hypothetical protein